MDYAGKTLIVKEEVNNREEDGTGLNVWDGSLLLARYLEQNPEKVRLVTLVFHFIHVFELDLSNDHPNK